MDRIAAEASQTIIMRMYREAERRSRFKPELVLQTFQKLLRRIPKWSPDDIRVNIDHVFVSRAKAECKCSAREAQLSLHEKLVEVARIVYVRPDILYNPQFGKPFTPAQIQELEKRTVATLFVGGKPTEEEYHDDDDTVVIQEHEDEDPEPEAEDNEDDGDEEGDEEEDEDVEEGEEGNEEEDEDVEEGEEGDEEEEEGEGEEDEDEEGEGEGEEDEDEEGEGEEEEGEGEDAEEDDEEDEEDEEDDEDEEEDEEDDEDAEEDDEEDEDAEEDDEEDEDAEEDDEENEDEENQVPPPPDIKYVSIRASEEPVSGPLIGGKNNSRKDIIKKLGKDRSKSL